MQAMTRIEDIEAREKEAMPGPWKDVRDQADEPNVAIVSAGLIIAHLGDFYPEAEFAAHAREDIPYLLTELREAREKLEAVEKYGEVLAKGSYSGLWRWQVKIDLDRILKGGSE